MTLALALVVFLVAAAVVTVRSLAVVFALFRGRSLPHYGWWPAFFLIVSLSVLLGGGR